MALIRLAVYLVGLLLIAGAVWLAALAFENFIPVPLAAAVVLVVLGFGVMGAAYVLPERPLLVNRAGPPPPYQREVVEESYVPPPPRFEERYRREERRGPPYPP